MTEAITEETAEERRYEGKVKWFNIAKGFGFITTDDIDDDVFVHYQNTPKCKKVGTRRLLEGQIVSFELAINGSKGYEALAVAIEQPFVYS
ncbi:MAG: cold shock domain-containing protein [Algicola sp.]|nr:cold shock domain-containing protein [Algicola sp.]